MPFGFKSCIIMYPSYPFLFLYPSLCLPTVSPLIVSLYGHRRLSDYLHPPVASPSGRASPIVWHRRRHRSVRQVSGPCLLFGHSPASGCSWPSVGPAIDFFLQPPVWLPPLQPLFSHSNRWMVGHSGYSATVRPPPLLGCR